MEKSKSMRMTPFLIRLQMEKKLLSMTMGEHWETKRNGLSTKEIIRLNTNEWELNCYVDGWNVYYFNLTDILNYFNPNK